MKIYTLTGPNGKSVELTESELDALYEALGDFQDYGDGDAVESDNIRSKIHSLE